MIEPDELRNRITTAMPDAQVTVRDLTGTKDHYEVEVVSQAFAGVAPIERHRKVYGIFSDVMGGALHALSLQTVTPEEKG